MAILDVTGLPENKVKYLEQLIENWKKEETNNIRVQDDVKPSDFIVKKSHVIGGRVTREMAYE